MNRDEPHAVLRTLWPQLEEGERLDGLSKLLYQRQHQAYEAGLSIVERVCEPWWGEPHSSDVIELGGTLYLYARVVDDFVDEGLLAHRAQLLKAQPLVWRVAQRLCALAPTLAEEQLALITRLCDHNAPHSHAEYSPDHPSMWGLKNEHVLLFPSALQGRSLSAPQREALLGALWWIQALDELQRGWGREEVRQVITHFERRREALDQLIGALSAQGWRTLAHDIAEAALTLELRLIREGWRLSER